MGRRLQIAGGLITPSGMVMPGRMVVPGGLLVLGGVLLSAPLGCREKEDPTARQEIRDATITAEVRSRILAVGELAPLPLQVSTGGATVRVTGSVQDSAQAEAIESIASGVRGVEHVQLKLRVVPAPDTTSTRPAERPGREQPKPEPEAPPESLPSLEEAG